MKIKNLNKIAFSLLEVLLASVIFIISIVGVFATLNAVRVPVANKENQLAAAVFGKQVLESLYSQVSATTYYSACVNGAGTTASPCQDFTLSLGPHQISIAILTANGLSWPSATLSNQNLVGGVPVVAYTVSCADGIPAIEIPPGTPPPQCSAANIAHRVDLNINWLSS